MPSTNPSGCGSLKTTLCNFVTNDAGESSGTATGDMPLNPPGQVMINGSPDLSDVIMGPNSSCVYTIVYQPYGGPARDSTVNVYGQGPQGIGSGSLYLTFKTKKGRTHDLTISSSSPSCHSDTFQDATDIVEISWKHES
jgi:hypothetical protein